MIASMWIGNLMLVILNLPLIGMWVKLLTVPYRCCIPSILVFCAIGVYSLSTTAVRRRADGAVRAARLRLRQARLRAGAAAARLRPRAADGGEPAPRACCCRAATRWCSSQRPISLVLLLLAAALLLLVVLPAFRKTREEAFKE